MALTIGDALLKLGVDTKELDAGMKKAGKSVETSMGNMQKHMKMAGMAMVGASAAIAGAFAMTVRAAAKEEKGMLRLQVAAENVGIAYDEVRGSLERWIDTMQQKTAIADTEQRDSLASLIRITRDVEEAQDLLVLAMDVAVGTGKDLTSATTLLMYALSGNWGMLERYIPAIKEAANEEEKWLLLRKLFKGQAEAFGKSMAGQYQLLKHNIGDIAESIGFVLLPIVLKVGEAFNHFARQIKAIPQPLIVLGVAFVGLAGAIMGVAGAAMLAIPGIISLGAAIGKTTAATTSLTVALAALKGALLRTIAVAALALAPFVAIAAVVVGLVVSVYALSYSLYRLGGSLGIVKDVAGWAWNQFMNVYHWVVNLIGSIPILSSVLHALAAAFNLAADVAGWLWDRILELKQGIVELATFHRVEAKAAKQSAEMLALLTEITTEQGKANILAAQSEAWFRDEIDNMTDAQRLNFAAMLDSYGMLVELDQAVLDLIGHELVMSFAVDTSTKGFLEQAAAAEDAGLSKEDLASSLGELETAEYGAASGMTYMTQTSNDLLSAWHELITSGGVLAGKYDEVTMAALDAYRATHHMATGAQLAAAMMSIQTVTAGKPGWQAFMSAVWGGGGIFGGVLGGGGGGGGGAAAPSGGFSGFSFGGLFGEGGLITEPTLLYGLRSMRPYALAGEKGTEVVSPVGAGATNFYISGLTVREEADIHKIARELERLRRTRGTRYGVQL